jgi:hypothetical protein
MTTLSVAARIFATLKFRSEYLKVPRALDGALRTAERGGDEERLRYPIWCALERMASIE